jgi:hypothetical protein
MPQLELDFLLQEEVEVFNIWFRSGRRPAGGTCGTTHRCVSGRCTAYLQTPYGAHWFYGAASRKTLSQSGVPNS